MDRSSNLQKSFIHPSRAHLFQKSTPLENVQSDKTNPVQSRHVSRTWNNRRDRVREKQPEEELLVFGYACKLFPPNEHSSAIAKNQHLIVWNEDHRTNLLIDRYDCRASLHNLTEFDADSWNKTYQVSEEEAKLEEHLDEERYRALFVEELEEDIRHEEELKRLHASIAGDAGERGRYGEVGYQYDDESNAQYDPTDPTNDEEEEQKPFIAPTSLAIPKEMEIPATEKTHAIIEKTALFVSKQGVQMEIVLKAKQANNSQFQFLQFDHYLNPYYKHVVKRIKEGKYTPGIQQNENKDENESDSDSSDGGDYLHPSLFASSHKKLDAEKEEKTKAIRTIDPDHPLAKLIEKGRQANAIKQYQKMAEAVYGYYQQQQNSQNGGSYNSTTTTLGNVEPPPLPSFMTMNTQYSTTNTMPNHSHHLEYHADTPPPPGEEPFHSAVVAPVQPPPPMETPWRGEMVPPPPDQQTVVEEIAKKVAVGGETTEKALICLADPNYSFLNPWHELHPYYQFRKTSWVRALFPPPPPNAEVNQASKTEPSQDNDKNSENKSPPAEQPAAEDSNQILAQSAPISFSIKPRKDATKKPLPVISSIATSVLGGPGSDDDSDKTTHEPEKVVIKKEKPNKRRFTDEPPDYLLIKTQNPPTLPTSQPLLKDVESTSKVSIPVAIAQTMSSSSFTAVTPSGESASIRDLRNKQAARRKKALLFLKSKQEQADKENDVSSLTVKQPPEQSKLSAIASEDIFDLTASSQSETNIKEQTPPPPLSDETATKAAISKLEILQKLASTPTSRSSSPLSCSSGKNKKRSRSRSRSRSRTSDSSNRPSKSRDLPSSYSKSKSRDGETSSKFQQPSRSPSPMDDDGGVPSAYRVRNSSRKAATPGSREPRNEKKRRFTESHHHRRSKHRSRDRERKSTSGHSIKHKHKHSSSDEKKKKKRKKEKKRRKRPSSSSRDNEDGEVEEDESMEEEQEEEEDKGRENSSSIHHGAGCDPTDGCDVTGKERSEGEIESD